MFSLDIDESSEKGESGNEYSPDELELINNYRKLTDDSKVYLRN
jgi:hypothetical protein